ncbi:MAG: RNA polymerase sigma factor (sigma-70 family) [Planctomycetota bacterium]|jgi:RNA polymerase sigma factor (sigma-70 family)
MTTDPQSDLDALLREEPYVRALARVLCAGHEDEIVQQTWLQACEHRGKPVKQPRAWLATIVRNVTKNLLRRETRIQRREQVAAKSSVAPSSIELMQREERRRKLVELIDTLPKDQREVMLLRYFEGMPARDIAAQLELPASTVWNLHRRALQRMRHALDATAKSRGQTRSAWLLPLNGMPWAPPIGVDSTATGTATTALPASILAGSIAITMKTKFLAATAVVAAIALTVYWPETAVPVPEADQNAAFGDVNAATGSKPGGRAATGQASEANATREVANAGLTEQALTGTLEVTVRFSGENPGPAANSTITYRASGEDRRLAPRCQTNEAGIAIITDLAPGRMLVHGDRHERGQYVEIEAGKTATLEITYPEGVLLRGIVIDDNERPIAGALIETGMPMLVGRDPQVLAFSGDDGRFAIRSAFSCLIGARAEGFLASPLQYSTMGNNVDLRIQLVPGGGTVAGTVVDEQGTAIADALICVGSGELQGLGIAEMDGSTPLPLPALVRSDQDGRFRALAIPTGDVPVWARAVDKAPWRGTCSVANYGTSGLRITMQRGGVLRGFVRTPAGDPVPKAEVIHGDWQQVENVRTYSDANGAFELRGLPLGAIEVMAEHDSEGRTKETVHLASGKAFEHDLVLSRGLELRGKVVDQHGKPVAKVHIEASAEHTPAQKQWRGYTRTDEAGHYLIPNCPMARPLRVKFSNTLIAPHVVKSFDPQKGTLDVTVKSVGNDVHIVGCIVDPNGKPLAGVRVSPRSEARSQHLSPVTTEADGTFAFGPLPEGIWKLAISHAKHPSQTITSRQLGGDERWDVGNVALALGGTAIIRPQSVPGTDLYFMIADTQTTARWTLRPANEPVTTILRPGDYLLQAWGKRAAAQVVRFTITGGQQTEILLHTQVGTRQRLEFAYNKETETTHGATLAVHKGKDKIVDKWLSTKPSEDWGYDLWLLPGTYRVTLSGKLRAETTLTIGATEPPPLTIKLVKR